MNHAHLQIDKVLLGSLFSLHVFEKISYFLFHVIFFSISALAPNQEHTKIMDLLYPMSLLKYFIQSSLSNPRKSLL